MSVTASRSVTLASSIVLALALFVAPAAAQDAATGSTELRPSDQATTSSQRARRAWVPRLRLRSIAPMSEVAPSPADDGPRATDPRWFERADVAPREAGKLAPWIDRVTVPRALPCGYEETSGEVDCRDVTTTVVIVEGP